MLTTENFTILEKIQPMQVTGRIERGCQKRASNSLALLQCPKVRWRHCEACQRRIQEEGLEDEFHLQSWFVGRINTFLKAQGRILIGWDEILEGGLSPGAVVMSWRVGLLKLWAPLFRGDAKTSQPHSQQPLQIQSSQFSSSCPWPDSAPVLVISPSAVPWP